LLLVEPGGAVDAAQHGVLGIAAPVGARHSGQLEGAGIELAGRGEVRSAAEVDPRVLAVAGAVHRDGLAVRQLHHPLCLERLALLHEEIADLLARPHLAGQRFVGGDDAPYLLLDRGQLFFGEGAVFCGRREIVIEAVVRRRPEGNLGSREEVLHCLREHMRIIVPHELERVGFVARSDQRQGGIPFERPHDIAHLAIDPRGERGFGEARTDRRGHIRRGRSLGHLPHRAVGKRNLEHLGHRARHVAMRRQPLNRLVLRHISKGNLTAFTVQCKAHLS